MRRDSGEWQPTKRMARPPHETEDAARTRRIVPEPPTTHRMDGPTEPVRRQGERYDAPTQPVSSVPTSPAPSMRGRASVPAQRTSYAQPEEYDTLAERPLRPGTPWFGPDSRLGGRGARRGLELSIAGGLFALIGWGAWALDNQAGSFITQLVLFVTVIAVSAGVFFAARLAGYLFYEKLFRRKRHTARLAHLLTAAFLIVCGVKYLQNVKVIAEGIAWIQSLF
ncbi:hypothetical protein Afil01_06390 [Actinorhabdospora filicis]|uniref:Uncharacterized protein n=1 Tax=Actinorhabdospora filicis TaxID=1785913 RepID=A0A9W6W1F3_9ACTN|nr:hypothetical protein [Actinorhabdospora filicis]GLZ75832.1 hypothetical protein Afil01_06390 [Actinorhabdospora filicis]